MSVNINPFLSMGAIFLFLLPDLNDVEFNLDYTVKSYTQYESYVNTRKQALSRIWGEEMLGDKKSVQDYIKNFVFTILEQICIINDEMRFKPIDEEKMFVNLFKI